MYYYAQLDEKDFCYNIMESVVIMTDYNMVQVASLTEDIIGLWYDRDDCTFKVAPIHALADHSTDQINYKDQDVWLNDVLDGKAESDHTHSDYALTDHTHSNYANSSHTHDYAASNHTHSYLPLSGGTMTGHITGSGNFKIQNSANTGSSIIYGGTGSADGAWFVLGGKNNPDYPGRFQLKVSDGTNNVYLQAKPDGTFSWNGKYLVRTVNNTNADINGNVNINNFDVKATNPITSTSNDTVAKWCELGGGVYYFNTTGYLLNQPAQYGFVINYENGSNVFQIWKTQVNGALFVRSGNANGWGQNWTEVLTSTGGTISGEVNFSGGLVKVKGNQALYATDTRLTVGSNNLETYIVGDAIYSRVAITVASDERLKEDIQPSNVDKLADFISNVEIVDYKYKSDDEKHIGVIAQQLEKADPEIAKALVKTEADGYKYVSFSELVFPLIAAVQKLQKRVEELENAK